MTIADRLKEHLTLASYDKRMVWPIAVGMRCQLCRGPGFTSDTYFCTDICRGQARMIVELTSRRFGIDWAYLGQVWHAYCLKRP